MQPDTTAEEVSVQYPESDVKDHVIEWPDMRESFPCEASVRSWGYCGGDNPAGWIVRRVLCCAEQSSINLLCTACKDYILLLPAAHCKHCLHVFDPASTAISSIEPLGVK